MCTSEHSSTGTRHVLERGGDGGVVVGERFTDVRVPYVVHGGQPTGMTEPVITLLDDVWRDITDVCDGLTAAQWATPTDCPGWTVHDNVAHMIGTERMLLGEQPDAGRPMPATRRTCATTSAGPTSSGSRPTGRSTATTLLDEFRAVTGRRLDVLKAMSTARSGTGRASRPKVPVRTASSWRSGSSTAGTTTRTSARRWTARGILDGPVADLSIGRIPGEGARLRRRQEGGRAAGLDRRVRHRRHTADRRRDRRAARGSRGAPRRPAACPTARIAMDRRTFTRLAGGRWTGDHARRHGTVDSTATPTSAAASSTTSRSPSSTESANLRAVSIPQAVGAIRRSRAVCRVLCTLDRNICRGTCEEQRDHNRNRRSVISRHGPIGRWQRASAAARACRRSAPPGWLER